MNFKLNNIYFSTFSVNRRVSIFLDFDETNQIILNSFTYLTEQKKLIIYSFVIMKDHIHLIWNIDKHFYIDDIDTMFRKYTGRKIKDFLGNKDIDYLNYFTSNRSDRKYKIWKLNTKDIRILHPSIYKQKLNYIHFNPTKGSYKTVENPEDYYYSSALSYKTGLKNFDFLELYFPE